MEEEKNMYGTMDDGEVAEMEADYRRLQAEEWPDPIPLDESGPRGAFPLGNYTKTLADMTSCVSAFTQTSPDMAGVLMLGVLAAIFQSRFTLKIRNHWKEPLSLFTMAVAPPGERKSAVLSLLTKPVLQYEHQRNREDAQKTAQDLAYRDSISLRVEALKREYGKKRDTKLGQELSDAVRELADCKVVQPYRIAADDATPEKLAILMHQQNGAISVFSAEGGVFDAISGRYDSRANYDVYLKGHAGDSLSVDRVGRESLLIPEAHLSMAIAVQPDVLGSLMSNRAMQGRGLAARFLYTICKPYAGKRMVIREDIPESVLDGYGEFITDALDCPYSGELSLSGEAYELFCRYQADTEKRLNGDLNYIPEWGSKLTGAVARIAALLYLTDYIYSPLCDLIPAEYVVKACEIGDYLSVHAKYAYEAESFDPNINDAKYILNRILLSGKDSLTRGELTHLIYGRFRNGKKYTDALNLLIEHSCVATEEALSRNGRLTDIIHVNPKLMYNRPPLRQIAQNPRPPRADSAAQST